MLMKQMGIIHFIDTNVTLARRLQCSKFPFLEDILDVALIDKVVTNIMKIFSFLIRIRNLEDISHTRL